MPKRKEHYDQFEKNCEFLTVPNLKEGYKDWYITGVFYCTVHLIEAYIDKYKGTDTKNHLDRLNIIRENTVLRQILSDYNTIYNQSRRARYYCETFSEDDISFIDEKLENIKSKICQLVCM